MNHVGEVCFRDLNGEWLDFRCPERRDPVSHRSQWKAADAIKQAAHCKFTHAAAAFATVFVMLIAVCAV